MYDMLKVELKKNIINDFHQLAVHFSKVVERWLVIGDSFYSEV